MRIKIKEMKKEESFRRLLHFTVGFTLALVLSHYFLSVKSQLVLAAVFGVILLLTLALKGTVRLRAALLCLGASAGFLWNAVHYEVRIAPFESLVGAERTVFVRVTDYPLVSDEYSRLTVRLEVEGYPTCKAYIYDYDGYRSFEELLPGDEIEIDVRFTSALKTAGEDNDSYVSNGVFARGYLSGGYEVTGRWDGSFLYFPKTVARAVKDAALSVFPEDVAPFMKALLTGDKAELYGQTQVYTNLQIASIVHVVAVSGMHVAFLISVVRAFTGRRRITAFVCVPLVIFFMAMTGFTPSVVRAGFMYITVLLAPLVNRESDPATTLSFPLLVLLLLNPEAIGSISLQLSFAAMAGLMVFSKKIQDSILALRGKRDKNAGKIKLLIHKAAGWIAGVVGCSVGATIFTVPLTVFHFGFASLYGILTNILCLWAISIAFNLGYLVCIIGMVLPQLGAVFGAILGILPRYIIAVSDVVSTLPYAALYTSNNLIGWWLVFVYLVFGACYFFSRRDGFRPVFPICAAIIALGAVSLFDAAANVRTLRVTAIDVGQGQSIVAMQGGSTVVIDCGNTFSGIDAGGKTSGYLLGQGRSTIDVLILTHMHTDHVDGVESLMYRMNVKVLIMPADQTDSEYYGAIVQAAQARGTEIILLSENTYITLDELSLTLFAPMGSTGTNERGIIILGEYRDFEFLVTGDVNSSTERLLVALYDLPEVELYVAGHHGSSYSSGEYLLGEISPETVFISVGYNSYGHPTQDTLDRLDTAGASIYRTDEQGNLSITVNE